MNFHDLPFFIILTFVVTGHLVLAGPGGYIALTNGTPYAWNLTYSHSYHMDWNPVSIIPARTSVEHYAEYHHHLGDNGDGGAEATYTLIGSPQPASFTLQARQHHGKRFQIQYHETLSSLNNPENSLLDLGFIHDGSVLFILSGNGEEPYISSNPPIAWMQATLPTIGSLTLREISLVASHDSGMSELTRLYGGVDHNTKTQAEHVYGQLKYGARYFDIRPVYRKGRFYTGHFTQFGQAEFGAMGRMMDDIIKDINSFNAEYPGELIILEISHELDDGTHWRRELSPGQWQKLYTLFKEIKDPWTTSYTTVSEDITMLPIHDFIQPGSRSAVIIRLPDCAPLPDGVPGTQKHNSTDVPPAPAEAEKLTPFLSERVSPLAQSADGIDSELNIELDITSPIPPQTLPPTTHLFIFATQLPHYGTWSNTQSPRYLSMDQLSKMAYFRDSPPTTQPPFRSTWTITQNFGHVFDVFNHEASIIGLSKGAYKAMFGTLWNGMREEGKWVNLLEVDDIREGVAALVMGINDFFASGRFGREVGEKMVLQKGVRVRGKRLEKERGRVRTVEGN